MPPLVDDGIRTPEKHRKDHVDYALEMVGYTEKRGNRGEYVDYINVKYGGRKGGPWCAAFISDILTKAKALFPKVRSVLARKFVTKDSYFAIDVYHGTKTVSRGTLVIWQKGKTISGHIGVASKDWDGSKGETVEGNTSSGIRGSQSNGGCIAQRIRRIEPFKYFRIKWFTEVKYG